VRFLETTPFLPLGVDEHAIATERVHPLAAGDTLLLYTDGLVERRDESIDVGFERLRDALRDAPGDVEALCDHVLDRTLGDHPGQDDVAVLTVRLLGQTGGPMALTLPATTDAVTVARHRLRAWLGASAPELDIGVARDLELAWSEACTNAVRHAYGPGDATFTLRAERAGNELVLEVRDHGRWREPLGARGGWGLRLIRAVCESVDMEQGADGTRVVMRQSVSAEPAAAGAGPALGTRSEA
jgi:anti-sigma regulatory factor (Ser/Thr protein kinase)